MCWFVSPDDNSKSIIAISVKLSACNVMVPEKIPFDFGDHPDVRPDIRFINLLNSCLKIKMRISLETSYKTNSLMYQL